MDGDSLDYLEGDEKIIAEAKGRFERCTQWEAVFRQRYVDDIKFANADSDNGYQWPNDLQKSRVDADKPTLTINKTAQHNLMIINECLQNKAEIKVRPVGDGATFDSAEVYQGLLRHTEYISNAQSAYTVAITSQVEGGIGYWRVVADYEDSDSFNQDLYVRTINNALSVFIDPDIIEKDGSDARFAFIFDDIPRDLIEKEFPELKFDMPTHALGNNDTWLADKHIRVAEYYRSNEKKDTLIAYKDEQGELQTVRRSKMPKIVVDALLEDPQTKTRSIIGNQIEWYKIAGDKIIDRRVGKNLWPGKYIPIVRIIGRETIIEGQLDRKGHTRALKDSQRMYNYNSSASVEYGALQTKAPWIAPAQAIEEYTQVWENANTKNYSVLPWNHVDEDGQPIPPPERITPPQGAQFYVEERQLNAQDMMMVSGQYQDSLGQQSNAVSGKAINQRERQGDKATYHFTDNQAIGLRYTGKILMDLYPHFYDTKRIKKILSENGDQSEITIDPQAAKAYERQQKTEEGVIAGIFNPNVGKYDVEADVGPNYATRRQETFNAISQILTSNEHLTPVIGDLLFKNADFPGANEIAERLKRMVPPQALGEGQPPQVAQLQEQVQKMGKMLETAIEELASERMKLKGKEQQKNIDVYEAITKRMEAIFKNVVVTPKDSASMLHDIMTQEHQSNLNLVEQSTQAGIEADAQKQPDMPQANS